MPTDYPQDPYVFVLQARIDQLEMQHSMAMMAICTVISPLYSQLNNQRLGLDPVAQKELLRRLQLTGNGPGAYVARMRGADLVPCVDYPVPPEPSGCTYNSVWDMAKQLHEHYMCLSAYQYVPFELTALDWHKDAITPANCAGMQTGLYRTNDGVPVCIIQTGDPAHNRTMTVAFFGPEHKYVQWTYVRVEDTWIEGGSYDLRDEKHCQYTINLIPMDSVNAQYNELVKPYDLLQKGAKDFDTWMDALLIDSTVTFDELVAILPAPSDQPQQFTFAEKENTRWDEYDGVPCVIKWYSTLEGSRTGKPLCCEVKVYVTNYVQGERPIFGNPRVSFGDDAHNYKDETKVRIIMNMMEDLLLLLAAHRASVITGLLADAEQKSVDMTELVSRPNQPEGTIDGQQ